MVTVTKVSLSFSFLSTGHVKIHACRKNASGICADSKIVVKGGAGVAVEERFQRHAVGNGFGAKRSRIAWEKGRIIAVKRENLYDWLILNRPIV